MPVFVPLSPEELELMSRDCDRLDFGRGERIVHQGDQGDAMYVVLEGTAIVTIKTENDAEREVARLSRGEFFGEMALLTGDPRTASVTAVDDLAVLVIHKDALQAMLEPLKGIDWKTLLAAGSGSDPRLNIAIAFRELAENADKISQLNISPDLLSTLLDQPSN